MRVFETSGQLKLMSRAPRFSLSGARFGVTVASSKCITTSDVEVSFESNPPAMRDTAHTRYQGRARSGVKAMVKAVPIGGAARAAKKYRNQAVVSPISDGE